MHIHQAIMQLNPTAVTVAGNEEIGFQAWDSNNNLVSINIEEAQALVDSKAYQDSRRSEYPPIGDQLDDLFKAGAFSTEMTATLQAVKDKYPKE